MIENGQPTPHAVARALTDQNRRRQPITVLPDHASHDKIEMTVLIRILQNPLEKRIVVPLLLQCDDLAQEHRDLSLELLVLVAQFGTLHNAGDPVADPVGDGTDRPLKWS